MTFPLFTLTPHTKLDFILTIPCRTPYICPCYSLSPEHRFSCFLTELSLPILQECFLEETFPSLLWLPQHLICIFPTAIVFSAVCYSYLRPCLFLPLTGELLKVAEGHALSNSDSPHSVANVWHMVGARSMCGMTLNYNG